MPWIDILIVAVVAILFGVAVYRTVRRRRGGCGCGCNGCPYHGSCEKGSPQDSSK